MHSPKSQIERSRGKPVEVAFDFFRKVSSQPCISEVESTGSAVLSTGLIRSFSDQSNNIVLLCAYLYVCKTVTRGLVGRLAEQLRKDIDENSPNLINIPEAYRQQYHSETVAVTLLNGLVRLERMARSAFHQLHTIQSQFISISNLYPFFRFCLVVWLRLKTIREFKEAPVDMYLESVGNEITVLSNYASELRGLPLDILCNALNLRLCLRTTLQDEFYGGRKCKDSAEHELNCFSLVGINVMLQIDDDSRLSNDDVDISSSRASIQPKSTPLASGWGRSLSAQSSLKSFHNKLSAYTKETPTLASHAQQNCSFCSHKLCICNQSTQHDPSPRSNQQQQPERRPPMFFQSSKLNSKVAAWSRLDRHE